jgi:hypothetical protein
MKDRHAPGSFMHWYFEELEKPWQERLEEALSR